MTADGMTGRWSRTRTEAPTTRFFRLAQLRRLRGCEEVAAVCYRVRRDGIEFLLVQTRGGRWTFPKGGVEPGLTHAQAAALEAFEEAGVHGRMEEAAFTRYVRQNLEVNAHLCEVLRLGPPQESNRNRTWFSAAKAKRHLQEHRTKNDGDELARVVDRAVTRIQRLCCPVAAAPEKSAKDAMQRVRFETGESAEEASFKGYLRHQGGDMLTAAALEVAVKAYLRQVMSGRHLRLGPAPVVSGDPTGVAAGKGKRRLLSGRSGDSAARVVEIDNVKKNR